MAQKVVKVHKMKSQPETTSLGQIATVTWQAFIKTDTRRFKIQTGYMGPPPGRASSLLGKLTNQQQAAGESFHRKVLNILTSFPWSITVETMKNCCRFVFYNNIDSFDIHFFWNLLKSSAHKTERNKFCHRHIISMVCTLIKQSSPPITT